MNDGPAHPSRHAGRDDSTDQADAAHEDPSRLGAHAAPYMDPDGTLHNIRPIGRLAVSGPDPVQRAADTGFGGMWFAPAKPDEDDNAPAAAATTSQAQRDTTQPSATLDIPTQPIPGPSAAAPTTPEEQAPPGAEHAPGQPGAPDAERVVIDLDVTGLFQGMTITGEQPVVRDDQTAPRSGFRPAEDTAPRTTEAAPQPGEAPTRPAETAAHPEAPTRPAETAQRPAESAPRPAAETAPRLAETSAPQSLDAASVRAKIDERMAAHQSRAGAEPEPASERPALSAADLEAIRWRLDGGTLREVVDDRDALRELGERLDGPLADEVDNVAKAGLLSVRAEVWRLLGELGMAAAAARLALAHAESARDLQSMVIAQAELAHILRLRGDFKEADRLFAKATGSEVPESLRSVVHENAGRSCFDQGRHMESLDHFARAVRLGRPEDTDLAARVGVCMEAVYIHVLRDGWGPYPRTREDILGVGAPAQPEPPRAGDAFDESTAEQPIIPPR